MTLICVKFDADLINISKVTSRKTKWPGFLAYPVLFKTFAKSRPRSEELVSLSSIYAAIY